MFARGPADEDLRHCLTVVSGYLGLLVEEGPGPVGPDHWVWLERAHQAAARAVALCEADQALREPVSPFRPRGPAE